MEKFNRWSDKRTGINPFTPPRKPYKNTALDWVFFLTLTPPLFVIKLALFTLSFILFLTYNTVLAYLVNHVSTR